MYGIEDELAAFCFDRAVTLFGQDVENEMQQASRSAKSDNEATAAASAVLRRRLEPQSKNSSGFKDPARVMSF
jgi:hypothetical protein